MKNIKEIDHTFNNVCIECGSKNIEKKGDTIILNRPIYICNDCLKIWSVEDNKWISTTRAKNIDNKLVVS